MLTRSLGGEVLALGESSGAGGVRVGSFRFPDVPFACDRDWGFERDYFKDVVFDEQRTPVIPASTHG